MRTASATSRSRSGLRQSAAGLDARTWKVGELARQTGSSVRTLHYYEEIGLLVPAARTASGHRLYTAQEVMRLQQIKSLQHLGLALGEIRGLLLGRAGLEPGEVVRKHLSHLREQMKLQKSLCKRLER